MTEDEMIRWHHQINGYEFEQTSGDSEGQASLVYYSSWGNKELYKTATTTIIQNNYNNQADFLSFNFYPL